MLQRGEGEWCNVNVYVMVTGRVMVHANSVLVILTILLLSVSNQLQPVLPTDLSKVVLCVNLSI